MDRRALLKAGLASTGLQVWASRAATAGQRHALLIGVSALSHQSRSMWLKGPVNDIALMQQALKAHSFADADIRVLADDGQGAPLNGAATPDRAGILAALVGMTARVRRGDVVVIYWSGHAVRAAGPDKAVAEADGQSTFLLAADALRVSRAAHNGWPLRGAVADAELGAAIDGWLASGATVLVVMDVCHAASATRSADDVVKWRGLKVSELDELGISQKPYGNMQRPQPDILPATLPAARPRDSGYVGLYACEDMQRTPEWALHGRQQGAFTYAVAQALLASASPQRYADVARKALDMHTALAQAAPVARSLWPMPVFEGSLQAPLWTVAAMPVWQAASQHSPAVAAWPSAVQARLDLLQPNGQRRQINLATASGALLLGRFPVGTQFEFQVRNQSQQPWYLRIFHVGPQGRWQAIFPERAGDAALLPAAGKAGVSRWQRTLVIDKAELKPESLLWVLARADARQTIDDALAALPTQSWRQELSWQAVAR